MIKGQQIRYLGRKGRAVLDLTVGREYTVTAGAGDIDSACGGLVGDYGCNIINDVGDVLYVTFSGTSLWGDWEIVS
jgi:hypothetical protein